jgi:hypothetical protein
MTSSKASPRQTKAKANAHIIQAEIVKLLNQNPNGLNFSQIFRQLKAEKIVNNFNVLDSNLETLEGNGTVSKEKIGEGRFAKSIFKLTEQLAVELFPNLPYTISQGKDPKTGKLEVRILKEKRDEFQTAIKSMHYTTEFFQPVVGNLVEDERAFLKTFMESMIKLLQLQSTILRSSDESEEKWRVYFTLITNELQQAFEDYSKSQVQQQKAKSLELAQAFRSRLSYLFDAIMAEVPVQLDIQVRE